MMDVESYCQEMNATYIKWMNHTTHIWMQHNSSDIGNNTFLEVGEGYEVYFNSQTSYTFTGLPGAMINYEDDTGFSGFDSGSEAISLSAFVEPSGNVTLNWQEPASMGPGDWYEVSSQMAPKVERMLTFQVEMLLSKHRLCCLWN
jgi:hypothetical protein